MLKVTCSYCGLPFKASVRGNASEAPGATIAPGQRAPRAQAYYCCTGCAMLARVPVDDKGQFPVNAHLVSMLATAFLFFNQLLFWLLATLVMRQYKPALAGRFLVISAAVAIVVWGAVAFVQWRGKSARASDIAMLALALGVHGWMIMQTWAVSGSPCHWPMALANAALIAWSFRGVWRKRRKTHRAS